jgi:hypothetical protein
MVLVENMARKRVAKEGMELLGGGEGGKKKGGSGMGDLGKSERRVFIRHTLSGLLGDGLFPVAFLSPWLAHFLRAALVELGCSGSMYNL